MKEKRNPRRRALILDRVTEKFNANSKTGEEGAGKTENEQAFRSEKKREESRTAKKARMASERSEARLCLETKQGGQGEAQGANCKEGGGQNMGSQAVRDPSDKSCPQTREVGKKKTLTQTKERWWRGQTKDSRTPH